MKCKLRPPAAAHNRNRAIAIDGVSVVDCAGAKVRHVLAGEEDAGQFHPAMRNQEAIEGEHSRRNRETAGVSIAGVKAGGDFEAPLVIELMIELVASLNARPGRRYG